MTPISKLQFYVKASLGQYFFLVWSRSLSHTNQLGEKSVKVLKFYSEQPFVIKIVIVRSWSQADDLSLVDSERRYLWQAINHLSGAQVVPPILPIKRPPTALHYNSGSVLLFSFCIQSSQISKSLFQKPTLHAHIQIILKANGCSTCRQIITCLPPKWLLFQRSCLSERPYNTGSALLSIFQIVKQGSKSLVKNGENMQYAQSKRNSNST